MTNDKIMIQEKAKPWPTLDLGQSPELAWRQNIYTETNNMHEFMGIQPETWTQFKEHKTDSRLVYVHTQKLNNI